jgi:hypothetical protein
MCIETRSAAAGFTGMCVCDDGFHGAGCEGSVDEGGGEGGGMLDSPFPWVAIIVPSLLVVLTGLVVGYWLHWQRKRMSLVGMLYGAGGADKHVHKDGESSDEDEDAAWDWVAKSGAGMRSAGSSHGTALLANGNRSQPASPVSNMGAGSAKGSRPLALMNTAASPASSLAGSTSAKSAQRAKLAVAPRMPPLLPRDITAGVRSFAIPITMRDFIPSSTALKRRTIAMLGGGSAAEERNARRISYCTVLYSVLTILWRGYGEPYYIRALRLRKGTRAGHTKAGLHVKGQRVLCEQQQGQLRSVTGRRAPGVCGAV